jgi:hypothetical protein
LKKLIEDLSRLRDPVVERPHVWIKDMRLANFEVGSPPTKSLLLTAFTRSPCSYSRNCYHKT